MKIGIAALETWDPRLGVRWARARHDVTATMGRGPLTTISLDGLVAVTP